MPVLRNIGFLATCRAQGPQGEVHPIPRAALAWEGDTIAWVGPEAELPARYASLPAEDAGGRLVIPGLVDCHTHLAFGGWRAAEFEQRIRGATYLEIAEQGGGIKSTMRHTRAADEAELVARASRWLEQSRQLGITTVECKSGYGLEADTELRLLRVYRRLAETQPTRIVSAGPGFKCSFPDGVFPDMPMFWHKPLVALTALSMATAQLTYASLAFLGFGARAPQADYGEMLSNARAHMLEVPLLVIAPAIALAALVLAFNILGDLVRDRLDPRGGKHNV